MRYMARRVLTGEWITRDLVLTDVESTRALSGPGVITGTLESEANKYLWDDRLRVADDWATIIYEVDANDQIANHGIVLPPTSYEDLTKVTCAGVSAYAKGYYYTDARLWGPQAAVKELRDKNGKVTQAASPEIPRPDPIVIFEDHWEWIQAQPYSNLGVQVIGNHNTGGKVLIGDYETPYRLTQWEPADLGSEMDNLAQLTPFDYAETTVWADADMRTPSHRIQVGYPRLGRRRDDLRFALGENIPVVPSVQTLEISANMLIGIGNGDPGPTMSRLGLYQEMPWFDGRLRRHRVVTDKTVKDKTLLAKKLAIYRTALEQRYDVTSVAVIDHPNARLSSIQLGDDIRVRAEHPEFGLIDLYVRVLSITTGNEDGAAVLTTSNSAFFRYAPSEEVT